MLSDPKPRDVLLASTTISTFLLILLGIYTAAVGAGLTCAGRWPLCDGAVFGLFPANWPSFVEWFHRFVAMVVGFMILGSAYVVLRGPSDRRSTLAMAAVIALLPVQIGLGAETVLGYKPLVLILHFSTAIVIFTGLLYVTMRSVGAPTAPLRWIRRIGIGITLALPVLSLISPVVVTVHGGPMQVGYTGLGLGIFAGMAVIVGLSYHVTTADNGMTAPSSVRWLVAGAGLLVLLQLVIGRVVSVLGLSEFARIETLLVLPGTAVAMVLMLGALWLSDRLAPIAIDGSSSPVPDR